MTDDKTHPDGCMCETCKHHRARKRTEEIYPEWARKMRLIRGQDSEPDPVLKNIPDGMGEREARARGLIE
jgi:hypothetical protein